MRLARITLMPRFTTFSSFGCFVFDLGVFVFEFVGASFSSFGCFVFEFWVLRFRDLGSSFSSLWVLRFRDLGSSFSRFGCFVLRSSFSSASFSKLPLVQSLNSDEKAFKTVNSMQFILPTS